MPITLRPHHILWLALFYEDLHKNGIKKFASYFSNHISEMEAFLTQLSKNRYIPVSVVNGPDYICERCNYYNQNKNECEFRDEAEMDEDRSCEELRRDADEDVTTNYDLTKIKTLGDALDLLADGIDSFE